MDDVAPTEMTSGPIVAKNNAFPSVVVTSVGRDNKNLPILPPCEELLPPTTPKDSSEAPFEAVLARDGFFYALTAAADALPPDDLKTESFGNCDWASACESTSRMAEAL